MTEGSKSQIEAMLEDEWGIVLTFCHKKLTYYFVSVLRNIRKRVYHGF